MKDDIRKGKKNFKKIWSFETRHMRLHLKIMRKISITILILEIK